MKMRIGDGALVIGETIGVIYSDIARAGGWKQILYVFYPSSEYFISPRVRAVSIEHAFSGKSIGFQAIYTFYNIPKYETK